MAFNIITAIGLAVLLVSAVMGQSTPSSSTTSSSKRSTTTSSPKSTTPTTWIDPYSDGKIGKAGARSMLCKKSMDAIHTFAAEMMGKAIQAMVTPEVPLLVPGHGTLTIKPPRVTEAKYAKFNYTMVPSNKIDTQFYDGQLAANGVWQFKPLFGDLMGGTYKVQIRGAQINVTNSLSRGPDARPVVNVNKCVANISNFRLESQGGSEKSVMFSRSLAIVRAENQSIIEGCNTAICYAILKRYEDEICRLFEGFVEEIINKELQQVPVKMCVQGDQYRVDYGLLSGQPTVNDSSNCIEAGQEGKYLWRNSYGSVPFNPAPMEWSNRDRMFSFHLSDFTFNTLFHQAHSGGHRFSAWDESPSSTSMTNRQELSLNCGQFTDTTKTTPSGDKKTSPTPSHVRKFRPQATPRTKSTPKTSTTTRAGKPRAIETKCLGALLANFSNFGPYDSKETGDVVFKTNYNRACSVFVESDKNGYFDGSSGHVEFYGPKGQNEQRPLLARAEVRSMRGQFTPKLNKANITGTIKLHTLVLGQSSYLRMSSEWLEAAAAFSMPWIEKSLNAFLDRYAQFTAPLPAKYECSSPSMMVFPRTMQLDCDVRVRQCETETPCRCFRDSCVCSQPCKPTEE